MKQLRIFRLFLATIFLVASLAYLFIGPQVHPMAKISVKSQIILSAIIVTIGVTLVWLLISILFGRIYCATVCPIGTLSDFFAWAGRKILPKRRWKWKPRRISSTYVLLVYLLALLLGLLVVPYVIEPWNIMRNVAMTIHPDIAAQTWANLGIGASTGALAGIVVFLIIAIWSAFTGRDYCNMACPLGAALGALDRHTVFHIEIDPDKCVSCGKCEEICPAHCIKVSERLVDNSRCTRCFDCLAVCDYDAIRYQPNRNIPLTPLFRRSRGTSPN